MTAEVQSFATQHSESSWMNIHEYQAKALIRKFGVAVPDGHVAYSADEAVQASQKLGGGLCVVKAQIHAGGRGKGGGVKVCKSADEAAGRPEDPRHAAGHAPDRPEGKKVKRIYVEAGSDIKRELYSACWSTAPRRAPVIMASDRRRHGDRGSRRAPSREDPQGTASTRPGLQAFQARASPSASAFRQAWAKAGPSSSALYKAFIELDCSIAEINPLVVTKDGEVIWRSTPR
jgi:succinyl-CoA synthetase beta subunit